MPTLIGVNTADTITAATYQNGGRAFSLGDRHIDQNGNEWVFVQASGAITGAGYVVRITPAYAAAQLSTSNDARGDLVGVAAVAFADTEYGWVQVKGTCVIQVAASCAANVRLNTTGTAGQIDDDGTAGAIEVQGAFLTTARAASAGTAPGILNYPIQGVTL